jgi:methionyl-tRNA formyltransferase
MKFKLSKIDNIIIFGGGSETTLKILKYLKKTNFKFNYFTNTRQLEDIFPNNLSLRKNLELNSIEYVETNNINNNKLIYKKIKKSTLGFGHGQPWKFKKKLLKKFNGNFVDFMGIPLPIYRGGAHYSWMILNKNRYGGCFLQNVDDHTIQGQNDTNKYFLKKEYKYPNKLLTPRDYFNYSSKIEINFLTKFFNKLKKEQSFNLKELDKKDLILFPRLVSKINSYINWDLDVEEIVRFINAFSDPYPGAITFLRGKKVFLKNAKIYKRNHFHTYTSGIITNIFEKKLFICSRGGIFNATCINLQNKKKENIKIGERFITNINYLELAKKHKKF